MKKEIIKVLVILSILIVGVLWYGLAIAKAEKVAICHNGHTIWVAEAAVEAHLKHGDVLGECGAWPDPEPQPSPDPEPEPVLAEDYHYYLPFIIITIDPYTIWIQGE